MRSLAVVASLAVLAGCAGGTPQQSFCSAARPILISKSDKLSRETERAIIGHDEIGQRLCGWEAPK